MSKNQYGPRPYLRAVGQRAAVRRKELGLTQTDVALRLGMSRTNLSNIEAGRQELRVSSAAALCHILGLSFRDLLSC